MSMWSSMCTMVCSSGFMTCVAKRRNASESKLRFPERGISKQSLAFTHWKLKQPKIEVNLDAGSTRDKFGDMWRVWCVLTRSCDHESLLLIVLSKRTLAVVLQKDVWEHVEAEHDCKGLIAVPRFSASPVSMYTDRCCPHIEGYCRTSVYLRKNSLLSWFLARQHVSSYWSQGSPSSTHVLSLSFGRGMKSRHHSTATGRNCHSIRYHDD